MNDPMSSPAIATVNPLARIRVVMVETSHPGNVGSAARAMKTMGLTHLVLVAPKIADVTTHRDAVALASGATDVLASARVVATFDEAISDVRFAIAFTARKRELSHPFKPLREAAQIAVTEAASAYDRSVSAATMKATTVIITSYTATCTTCETFSEEYSPFAGIAETS